MEPGFMALSIYCVEMSSKWNCVFDSQPIQGKDMSVEVYYDQFCNWKKKLEAVDYIGDEEWYIDDFLCGLRMDLVGGVWGYKWKPRTLYGAFLRAEIEETMNSWKELSRKNDVDKVFGEMSHPNSINIAASPGVVDVSDEDGNAVPDALGLVDDKFQSDLPAELNSLQSGKSHVDVLVGSACNVFDEMVKPNSTDLQLTKEYYETAATGNVEQNETYRVFAEMLEPVITTQQSSSMESLVPNKAENQLDDGVGQLPLMKMGCLKVARKLFDEMSKQFSTKQKIGVGGHEKWEPPTVDFPRDLGSKADEMKVGSANSSSKMMFGEMAVFMFDPGISSWFYCGCDAFEFTNGVAQVFDPGIGAYGCDAFEFTNGVAQLFDPGTGATINISAKVSLSGIVPELNTTTSANPEAAHVPVHGNQTHSSSSSKFPRIAVVTGITTLTMALLTVAFLCIFRFRRRKQRISNTLEFSGDRLSTAQTKESNKSPPPLLSLQRSQGRDQMIKDQNCDGICPVIQQGSKFNLEEIESATRHFSEVNLLGKSNVSSIYKGILKDGTSVVIKSINIRSCKSEEVEFMNGLSLLTSLKHKNLVSLRGFCCSKGRGECFLIYDFASKGNLSLYLDLEENSSNVLDWPSRVSIIKGIATGVHYLHSSDVNKPSIVHQNLCADKVLIDEGFNPLISDCGLLQLLADDVVYSAVKVSAAFGYMAPEYITTGRFTEKSDVYAFGVIILQVVLGRKKLTNSMLLEAESCRFEDFIDPNLKGNYSKDEATKLTRLALDCTNEDPDSRPLMSLVIEELRTFSNG